MSRYANKKHLAWIHDQPCILAASTFACQGPIIAHHLMRPWNGVRGMGLKANDRNLVPMCDGHHRELHAAGDEEKFFDGEASTDQFGKKMAYHYWLKSPHYEKETK